MADGQRGSGRFREASWDEALGLVAQSPWRAALPARPAAVMCLGSAGSTGALHDSQGLLERFLDGSGGATGLSGSYSNGAAKFVLPYLFGNAATGDPAGMRDRPP